MSTTVSYKGSTIATVTNETKTLNTAGTWVEDNIEINDNSLAELNIDNNYIILDDDPISSSVYVLSSSDINTVFDGGYYKVPDGYSIYISQYMPTTPILTNSWDLTTSLTDTVGGSTITLSGATQSSSGISLTAATHYASIPVKYRSFHTYEFDIASMTPSTGSTHGRFIMFTSTEGLIYRNGSQWATYLNGSWGSNWSSNGSLFAGKTLSIVVESGAPKFYIDGEFWKTPTQVQSLSGSSNIMIGSSGGQGYFNIVVTGIRVYEGVKYR